MLTQEDARQLVSWAEEMEQRSVQPPQITWETTRAESNLVVRGSDVGVDGVTIPDTLECQH
jgi:hypothetical protein